MRFLLFINIVLITLITVLASVYFFYDFGECSECFSNESSSKSLPWLSESNKNIADVSKIERITANNFAGADLQASTITIEYFSFTTNEQGFNNGEQRFITEIPNSLDISLQNEIFELFLQSDVQGNLQFDIESFDLESDSLNSYFISAFTDNE